MSDTPAPSPAHVVHLLRRWGDEAAPPELLIGGAMGTGARIGFALLLVGASALGGYGLVILWTEETPGWWFPLLFTVMIGGLILSLWGVYFAAIRTGNARALAHTRWRESLGRLQQTPCTIVACDVATTEDGAVNTFDLTVNTPAGTAMLGTWRPRPGTHKPILQTQLPRVGASARLWRIADAPADYPLVIEALDPSVLPGSDDPKIATHV